MSPHSSSVVWLSCRVLDVEAASSVLFASERRWRATRCCQREACWWRSPEDGRGFRCGSLPTPCCEEAQQRMSALRLLKNQPQRRHLWPQCWHSQDPAPTPQLLTSLVPSNPHRRLHVRPVRAAQASVLSSLSPRQHVHKKICTSRLTLPFPTVPSLTSLSTPRPLEFPAVFEWWSRQNASLCVWQTESYWNVPPMVLLMVVLMLMELVEGASRNWSRSRSAFHFHPETHFMAPEWYDS